MSHHDVQRALVIALFDPAFLDGPLPGLAEHERAQLLAVDRRALRTDPLRRRRTLRTLAEEFKVSTTLLLAETRELAVAEGFFSSRFFRDAILGRSALALSFGDFLTDAATRLRTPQLRFVVCVEATTARCRRGKARPANPGIDLAPGVGVGAFDAQVLDWMRAVERYLFELSLMPQAGLCRDAPPLPELSPPGSEVVHLLFRPTQSGVSLTPVDDDLHRVLDAVARAAPLHRRDAAGALSPAGVPAARAEELLESLLADGILAEGLPPSAVMHASR